jgi:hypothetical protein
MTTELQAGEAGAVDACAETVRIRILPESVLHQDASGAAAPRSFDPYNTDIRGLATTGERPRKTLDDMRRLSEAIVRNRRCSR